ncbi:MAG TPA: hypothetical protein VF080_19805 [Solirubrobacteraceae bacterium]
MIRLAAPLLVVAALALSACQTTQELSAERAKTAKKLVNQKGLTVSRENPNIAIGKTAVIQDKNGIAAVVELRNKGPRAQAGLPVSIAVTDAGGKALYRNDVAGLEDSLVSMSLLTKGEDAFWVNNQITATGKPAKVQAKVGAAKGKVPAQVPRFAISDVTLDSDSDGVFAKGTIVNQSKVAQRRLTIFCVARNGGKIVAAGRAILDGLPSAGAKPTKFTVFFIGNPKGAKLTFTAPPTVLE